MDCFGETYAQSRAAFRGAAKAAGARCFQYGRDDLLGAEGEALCVDVAVLGRDDTPRAALIISGVHGGEGFAGAAVQIGWLRKLGGATLTEDLRVVLVHGANPWGFSHMLRTTEANIDLNRNFRTSWPAPHNPAYAALAPFLHARDLDAGDDLRAWRDYVDYLDRNGWDIEGRAISGQSQAPGGLYYCGTGPDWANRTFRRILTAHAAGAARIGFIDFHTGVGDYGEVVHLIFAPPGSEARAQAMAWWGLAGDGASGFRARSVPPYEGLLCGAIGQELPGARIAGSVIEFGTGDAASVFRQDRMERWLRFEGRDAPDQAALRACCRDAASPRNPGWRAFVLREGVQQIDRLLSGLATWT